MDALTTIVAILIAISTMLHHPRQSEPAESPEPVATTGWATWYDWRPGQAAAGPALRRLLGKDWRGESVSVCVDNRCVRVRLTDWCACGPRRGSPTVIDLDDQVFRRLAPLSRGVIEVTVRP
jgi:hypothetical protein